MSWRDQLKAASFRGIEFKVNSHDLEIGRKNIFHDYPFRDNAELEDQGLNPDVINITGYIVQNIDNNFNYFVGRDALIRVLKKKGVGKLVDPFIGSKNVALLNPARITESFHEGGIARFQMAFKEVKEDKPFTLLADVASLIDNAVDALNDIYQDVFGTVFDITADLQKVSNAIAGANQNIKSKIRELKSVPGSVINSSLSIVSNAADVVSTVLTSPCDLAATMIDSYNSFLSAAGMLDDAVSRDILGECSSRVQNALEADRNSDELSQSEGSSLALASANCSTYGTITSDSDESINTDSTSFQSNLADITVNSPASAADQANQQVIVNLMGGLALTTACRIAVRTQFVSQDDALDLLNKVSILIDNFLDHLGEEAGSSLLPEQQVVISNDEVYQGTKQLKSTFERAMNQIGSNLANIVEHDVGPEVISSLGLAYEKYEDLDREQEIIDRNALLVLNPCFLPNGKTINILSE